MVFARTPKGENLTPNPSGEKVGPVELGWRRCRLCVGRMRSPGGSCWRGDCRSGSSPPAVAWRSISSTLRSRLPFHFFVGGLT